MTRAALARSGVLICFASAIAVGSVTLAASQATQTQRSTDRALPLAGTLWNLIELDGKPVLDDGLEPELALKADVNIAGRQSGQLVASVDGNQMTGSYVADRDSVELHFATPTLLATRVRGGRTDPPKSFASAIRATSRFSIHRSTLELFDQSGVVLARFAAASSTQGRS